MIRRLLVVALLPAVAFGYSLTSHGVARAQEATAFWTVDGEVVPAGEVETVDANLAGKATWQVFTSALNMTITCTNAGLFGTISNTDTLGGLGEIDDATYTCSNSLKCPMTITPELPWLLQASHDLDTGIYSVDLLNIEIKISVGGLCSLPYGSNLTVKGDDGELGSLVASALNHDPALGGDPSWRFGWPGSGSLYLYKSDGTQVGTVGVSETHVPLQELPLVPVGLAPVI